MGPFAKGWRGGVAATLCRLRRVWRRAPGPHGLYAFPKPGEADKSILIMNVRIAGARAVGIAGGAAKCAYVRNQLRFDAAIDHRAEELSDALATACPDGIDVYFENVGGLIWDAVLPVLNRYARVPVCGLVSHYNEVKPTGGSSAAETMLTVLRRSLLIRGFINTEFAADHYDSFLKELSPLVRSGDIRYREDISEGLEAAPGAFVGAILYLESAGFVTGETIHVAMSHHCSGPDFGFPHGITHFSIFLVSA
jgi:Zinc-binding dehydrogenase